MLLEGETPMFQFLMPFAVMIVLVVGGLLVVNLVFRAESPLPYALTVGGATLLSLLVFYLNARFMMKPDPGMIQLSNNGTEARAEVLSVQDTGLKINLSIMVTLGLKVKPAYGSEFQLTSNALVSRVAIPRQGDVITIKYDPENTQMVLVV
jgi:hypothetical protein